MRACVRACSPERRTESPSSLAHVCSVYRVVCVYTRQQATQSRVERDRHVHARPHADERDDRCRRTLTGPYLYGTFSGSWATVGTINDNPPLPPRPSVSVVFTEGTINALSLRITGLGENVLRPLAPRSSSPSRLPPFPSCRALPLTLLSQLPFPRTPLLRGSPQPPLHRRSLAQGTGCAAAARAPPASFLALNQDRRAREA